MWGISNVGTRKRCHGKGNTADIYRNGMIKTWYSDNPKGWTLVSGIWSPFYIQLRPISSYPILLSKIGYYLGRLIKEECGQLNKLLGVAMAGIPIAVAISLSENIPSCFTRKLEGIKSITNFDNFIKNYGEHSIIEGELRNGDIIGIVDDLVTKFDSKLIAIRQLEHEAKLRHLEGIKCSDVIVLMDREQGAKDNAQSYGINLHSLIPFTNKGIHWLRDEITNKEYEVINDYLINYEYYQNKEVQTELYNISKVG